MFGFGKKKEKKVSWGSWIRRPKEEELSHHQKILARMSKIEEFKHAKPVLEELVKKKPDKVVSFILPKYEIKNPFLISQLAMDDKIRELKRILGERKMVVEPLWDLGLLIGLERLEGESEKEILAKIRHWAMGSGASEKEVGGIKLVDEELGKKIVMKLDKVISERSILAKTKRKLGSAIESIRRIKPKSSYARRIGA